MKTGKPYSKPEAKFALIWRALGGPELTREHRFHPERRWRLDFAHLASRVAIEIEGGVWSGGRHTRGGGFIADCEKYNTAQRLGWRVFRLPTPLVTAGAVEDIKHFIKETTP